MGKGVSVSKKNTFAYLQTLAQKKVATVAATRSDSAFLGVMIGQKKMYLPLPFVHKIISQATITPVSHTQLWFQGLTRVEGKIYSVLNLGRWLDATQDNTALGHQTIVAFYHMNGNYAVLAEEILGITHFVPDNPVAETALTNDYQTADGTIFSVLSVDKLVNSPEFSDFSLVKHWDKLS